VIFGICLRASAVLAVPVVAGTSAYVMAEAFGWRGDLDANFGRAPLFSIAPVLSLAIGGGMTLIGVSPIQLLFLGSIAGGLGTSITLALMMIAARSTAIMGEFRIGRGLAFAGWLVTAIMIAACAIYLYRTLIASWP
jgi:Mn2+/Fe2+ NRAMP family transporter